MPVLIFFFQFEFVNNILYNTHYVAQHMFLINTHIYNEKEKRNAN